MAKRKPLGETYGSSPSALALASVEHLQAIRDTLDRPNWDHWPKGSRGQPALMVSNQQADRFVAAGLCTEDDLFRLPNDMDD
jgi:hypothetical protein